MGRCRNRTTDPMMSWRRSLAAVFAFVFVATVSLPGGSALLDDGLYLYVPDLIVVETEGDADEWLDNVEASMGIDGSDDPNDVHRKDLARVDRTARILERHWEGLHRTCDPDGVFALMYLETTYVVRQHIADGFFDDNPHLSVVTVAFIQLYFDAYHAYHGDDLDATPLPWQEAFSAADAQTTSVLEDMFLGMNGHINYDLGLAMYQTGLTKDDGTSRKADHDRINAVLQAAAAPVNHALADHYDPSLRPDNESDTYAWETWLTMGPIFDWRELAWDNAVALTEAPDEAARDLVKAEMEAHGYTVAQGFQTPKEEGAWEERLAYCEGHA